MDKDLVASYENKDIVTEYDSYTKLFEAETVIFDTYQDKISGKSILDIGCGAGRTTSFLKELSEDYTGLDYSSQMLKFCKKKFGRIALLQGDARNMAFGDKKFDFILFSFVGIDDIPPEDRSSALQEIHRILKDNGIFVFSSNNRNFVGAGSVPPLKITSSFSRTFKDLLLFLKYSYLSFKYNYLFPEYKNRQVFTDSYIFINAFSHGEAFLTYFIDKNSQAAQLAANGFETLATYDDFGVDIASDSDDSYSQYIHYVARKM